MARWRDDPANVRPMLASVDPPPTHQTGWIYEPKYDGIRALVDVRPGGHGRNPKVVIYSRNGHEKQAQFPAITRALASLASRLSAPLLLDGEIVAIGSDHRPLGFQQLQGRIHLTSPTEIARAEREQPTAIILFDLLRDGDEDLRGQPLAGRRLRLQSRVKPAAAIRHLVRLSEIVADDGRPLLARAKKEGWEGLIGKDGQSVYQSGRRTPAWRKLKLVNEQEFVIGGWTEPRQTRQHFGALLVGYYDAHRALRYAGSVGTGFDERELDRLARLFELRKTTDSPFADRVRTAEPAHWLRPDLVAEVRFTEWTAEGLLRHPVYLGTRTDKSASDVRRESRAGRVTTAPVPSAAAPRRTRVSTSQTTPATAAPDASTTDLVAQLSSLEASHKDGELRLSDGSRLKVGNLAKKFWPALGLTKGDLLRYYVQVAPMLLPVVNDRPLVMKRFPNGVGGPAFYQQRHPDRVPSGVRRETLPENVEPIDEEGPRDRLIGGSLATLLYMTQLAAISQDPWFSRVADPMHMDHAAIDLDPGDGVSFARVLDVARWVKDELDRLHIPGFAKTSGASGLHIYIPLPPKATYETGQLLCEMVATLVATAHPAAATIERFVKRRPKGTVYVDYLQNILGKTLATAYSARASDYAGVSAPITWQEVSEGVDPRDFTIRTAPARFTHVGDLWAALRTGPPVDLERVIQRSSSATAPARTRRRTRG